MDEPRCPHCGETNLRMLDKLPRPRWASTEHEQYVCNVCGKPFLHHVTPRGETQ